MKGLEDRRNLIRNDETQTRPDLRAAGSGAGKGPPWDGAAGPGGHRTEPNRAKPASRTSRRTRISVIAIAIALLILGSFASMSASGQGAVTSITYSTNTTLTADVYCLNLTIDPGVTVSTNGFNFYCSGAFLNEGTIVTGNPGNGAASVSSCAAGANAASDPNSFGGSGAGGGSTGVGGCGGAGGNGGSTKAAGGAGGASGNNKGSSGSAAPALNPTNALVQQMYAGGMASYLVGAGGGSGGGGGTYAGEAGGSGGYGLFVEANSIIAGTISTAGAAGTASPGASGGGGGGGAGSVILAFGPGGFDGGTYQTAGGSGGASGGAAGGSGGNGQTAAYNYGSTAPIPVGSGATSSSSSSSSSISSSPTTSGTVTVTSTTTLTTTRTSTSIVTSTSTTTVTSAGTANWEVLTSAPFGGISYQSGIVGPDGSGVWVANVAGLTHISIDVTSGEKNLVYLIAIYWANSPGGPYAPGGGCTGGAYSGLSISGAGVQSNPPPDYSAQTCEGTIGQVNGVFSTDVQGEYVAMVDVGASATISIYATTS